MNGYIQGSSVTCKRPALKGRGGRTLSFIRKWRLKCRSVADSLEEAGDRLFTFTWFASSQWRSIRTTNAIERLQEEFKRRIKTQALGILVG
jgi:putative transposase